MVLIHKMYVKNVLFIYHSPSDNTKKLSKHLQFKIKKLNPNTNLIVSKAIETNIDSFNSIDGVIKWLVYLYFITLEQD